MTRSPHRLAPVLVLGALTTWLRAAPTHALHDTEVSDDEARCQQAVSVALGKFVVAKTKCVLQCRRTARAGANPATDCQPAYAGATLGCVETAELKAEDTEVKKCVKDCPECYTGSDCSGDAARRVRDAETELDGFVARFHCRDTDGNTPAEERCEDGTARALAKFVPARRLCFVKCRRSEHAGKVPPGSCTPDAVSDPTGKTQACLVKAAEKASAAIDKLCEAPGARPACYGSSDGAAWVGRVGASVDGSDASIFCGSPSGAFVER